MQRIFSLALAVLALSMSFLASGEDVQFSDEEKRNIVSFGPWPPKLERDPRNRVSGSAEAAALGERLFFEPRLSATGSVLCASCHVPFRAFQDARARAFGLEETDRNTPSVLDVRFNRRFGWDGAQDSLSAQSIRPLLDPREMKSSAAHVAGFIRADALFSKDYERVFERDPSCEEDKTILVNIGKALAAYQETLVSGRTPFDEFRDALKENDAQGIARYAASAQRGLKIFAGKGNCGACHAGPRFSSGELADSRAQHGSLGEFRVPGLRSAARTAPYMHDGRVASLREVVSFQPALSEDDARDLVSFLESLSDGAR
jgi:cytochrome c peroxidase